MLPAMLSNLFWGAPSPQQPVEGDPVPHTTREEAGDWLLISSQNSCDSGNSRVNSECDLDSLCSDSSWVITPAPTFKRSSGHANSGEPSHPLEDLLIEHPAMSVYRQNSNNEVESLHESEGVDENIEERNLNHELALIENRRRQQLAAHMDIPVNQPKRATPKSGSGKPPKLTRRALKRHNPISRIGAKNQVQKCGFKAGRRRC